MGRVKWVIYLSAPTRHNSDTAIGDAPSFAVGARHCRCSASEEAAGRRIFPDVQDMRVLTPSEFADSTKRRLLRDLLHC